MRGGECLNALGIRERSSFLHSERSEGSFGFAMMFILDFE